MTVPNEIVDESILPFNVRRMLEGPSKFAYYHGLAWVVEQEAEVCMPDLRHPPHEVFAAKVVHVPVEARALQEHGGRVTACAGCSPRD